MEGKKYRTLGQDCKAVSEVMGAVLMISVVVLAFSAVAVTVFSDGEAVDPPHTPHTNLRENIDTSRDTLQIFHIGGEAIDLEDIRIILIVNETQADFNMSDFEVHEPEGNTSFDGVFALGDYIEIDPSSKINIEHGDVVDFYFVHTESSQVIQKTKLWIKGKEFPDWITPHTFPGGTAYDSYNKTWLDTKLVDKINDGKSTRTHIPPDPPIHENFTFAINTEELEIPEDTLFTNITLKIICARHDNSPEKVEKTVIRPEIYNGSQWTPLKPIPFGSSDKDVTVIYDDIAKYVKNTTELENLEVKITADGNAADPSDKYFRVDFIGIHLDF
ncbi:MAG TPA: type IV pilin N-terminal domain-containing protein [Chitinispirillaceae bacterium]|nr:type IV pilin N-terminal domain-containing protein [Chitinispirillaceae bacterium]